MKKIRCIVADDEKLARDIIEGYAANLQQLELVASCANGMEVYNALKTNTIDLLFLDIKMPQLSGIELLRTLPQAPLVIITTAYREYALEAYELTVIDYLLKPISFERFLKAIHKYEAVTRAQETILPPTPEQPAENSHFLYIKSDKKMVRVLLKEILYVEGLKDYVKVHTTDKTFTTYQTLTYFEEKLPAPQFLRVHRSYIISLDHIHSYTASQVEVGGQSIPIGASYSREVLKRLQA